MDCISSYDVEPDKMAGQRAWGHLYKVMSGFDSLNQMCEIV